MSAGMSRGISRAAILCYATFVYIRRHKDCCRLWLCRAAEIVWKAWLILYMNNSSLVTLVLYKNWQRVIKRVRVSSRFFHLLIIEMNFRWLRALDACDDETPSIIASLPLSYYSWVEIIQLIAYYLHTVLLGLVGGLNKFWQLGLYQLFCFYSIRPGIKDRGTCITTFIIFLNSIRDEWWRKVLYGGWFVVDIIEENFWQISTLIPDSQDEVR